MGLDPTAMECLVDALSCSPRKLPNPCQAACSVALAESAQPELIFAQTPLREVGGQGRVERRCSPEGREGGTGTSGTAGPGAGGLC